MHSAVSLSDTDWRTVLDFVHVKTAEIAEFDDEDEELVAVLAVVEKIEVQLAADTGRRE